MTENPSTLKPGQDKTEKHLYVIIHGYGSSKLKFLRQLFPQLFDAHQNVRALGQTIETADCHNPSDENTLNRTDSFQNAPEENTGNVEIYCPDFTKELSIFSTCDLNDLVTKILTEIDLRYENREYTKIYIIGYSMGAIIARKVYICACGGRLEMSSKGYSNQKPKNWVSKVDRIVLLAGINRGWTINHHLSLPTAVFWSLGAGLGNLMLLLNKESKPIIFQTRRGAPFLTQLCIEWLYMRKNASRNGFGDATTIQLLGTQDTLVSPEDNIDPISGQDFIYLEIPFSNHTNVVNIESPSKQEEGTSSPAQKRGAIFLSALKEDINTLKKKSRLLILDSASLGVSPQTTASDKPITDVIFVIHGIRDEGHWTNKIAQRVILENEKANSTRSADKQRHFAVETSRYGYFPMLLFALPWTRRAKVAWFMEQYAENLALYPDADFSFIGHSNGTYLLAQALEKYEYCRFKRVVFAGSVVPKQYQWSKHINNGRVERVLNYVATLDWVVAIFPNFLHWFQSDLGSAGHDGFEDNHRYVTNIRYIRGQHGAALNEYNWDAIAKFIVSDELDLSVENELRPLEIFQDTRGKAVTGNRFSQSLEQLLEIVGQFPWLVWIAIIAAIGAIGICILFFLPVGEWQTTCIFLVYAWTIWKILTII